VKFGSRLHWIKDALAQHNNAHGEWIRDWITVPGQRTVILQRLWQWQRVSQCLLIVWIQSRI